MNEKWLIIGQGLAGSVLALQCQHQGIDFEIWNDETQYCSSKYAAGLWNPVSFKRITAPEHIHDLLHHCTTFFERCNVLLDTNCFHHSCIHRIFPDAQYGRDWDLKSILSKYERLLGSPDVPLSQWNQPFQSGSVLQSGWLNVPQFLDSTKRHFQNKDQYFNFDKSIINQKLSDNKTIAAFSRIIFCTGLSAMPAAFDKIKIIPNKGHVLDIETENPISNNIVHYGNFAIPLDSHHLRVGSSYEWEKSDTAVDEKIVEELSENIKQNLLIPFKVKGVDVGLRPTVIDRNPIIGTLPKQPQYGIFNGLGTKGVLQAPLMAHYLIEHLTQGVEIPKAFSIQRFYINKN
jgi:glycine/D-amino acid oxidase-like deaminating enzyme